MIKNLLENLIESLREELQEYGEMLALLEQQQQMVISRQGPELLETITLVDAQAEAIRVAREEREQRRRHLARTLSLDEDTGFRELEAHLPTEYRPLLAALVEENNRLLGRVQQCARQNHLLLNRAVELMQKFIGTLLPGSLAGTYKQGGVVPASPATEPSLYEAKG